VACTPWRAYPPASLPTVASAMAPAAPRLVARRSRTHRCWGGLSDSVSRRDCVLSTVTQHRPKSGLGIFAPNVRFVSFDVNRSFMFLAYKVWPTYAIFF
jgi:hypothetical protein